MEKIWFFSYLLSSGENAWEWECKVEEFAVDPSLAENWNSFKCSCNSGKSSLLVRRLLLKQYRGIGSVWTTGPKASSFSKFIGQKSLKWKKRWTKPFFNSKVSYWNAIKIFLNISYLVLSIKLDCSLFIFREFIKFSSFKLCLAFKLLRFLRIDSYFNSFCSSFSFEGIFYHQY